jgi:hypothetical protein
MHLFQEYHTGLLVLICVRCLLCGDVEYDENGIAVFYRENDPIETISGGMFYTDILYSTRLSVVKFYAHWCGSSLYFVPVRLLIFLVIFSF